MDWINAVECVGNYMEKLRAGPAAVRDDDITHEVIRAAAVILPRFRVVASEQFQTALYDEYPQIGFTFNTFFNETVAFVLDNKRRSVPLVSWSNLLTTYMRDVAGTKMVAENGSLGGRMLAATLGQAGTVRNLGKAHQSTVVDKRLLSYADHELLAKWLICRDGFADMVSSLAVFLVITRP